MRFHRIIGLAAFSMLCLTRANAVTITETETHYLHDSWTFGPSFGGSGAEHVIPDYFPKASGPLQSVVYTSHAELSATVFLYNSGTTTLSNSPYLTGTSFFYFNEGGFTVGASSVTGPIISLAPGEAKTFSAELIHDFSRTYSTQESTHFYIHPGVIQAVFDEFYGVGYLGAQVNAFFTVSVTSTLTYNYAAVPEGGNALALFALSLGCLVTAHRRSFISGSNRSR